MQHFGCLKSLFFTLLRIENVVDRRIMGHEIATLTTPPHVD